MAVRHDDAVKAAVMAALLAGQSISEVAAEYKLPVGTIKSWSSRARAEPPIVTQDRAERVGILLMEYVEASLTTLRKQVEWFGNEEWLSRQDANEVAILHGVTIDKAIRLLEAISVDRGTGESS